MKLKLTAILVYVTLLTGGVACQQNRQNSTGDDVLETRQDDPDKTISSIGVTLSEEAQDKVQTWQEYLDFEEALLPYYAISYTEALTGAEHLATLSDAFRKSKSPEFLHTDRIRVRINILNSACQRLSDMNRIPAITREEVIAQVREILSAFEMLKIRINASFDIQNLESELTLDPDFVKILNATPVIQDSTSQSKGKIPVSNEIMQPPVKKRQPDDRMSQ
ncbi:MAG: hypothetical protein CR968_05190 [Flavobacteriia bacterium]|nr:MAG: hypothetical protein CR968_05190 [Flavobacteriia bacterium]